METNLLDYVVTRLNARKGTWPTIADETGVPRSTIAKIACGETPNPGVKTVEQLAQHLVLLERQEAERRAHLGEGSPPKIAGPVEGEGDRPSDPDQVSSPAGCSAPAAAGEREAA